MGTSRSRSVAVKQRTFLLANPENSLDFSCKPGWRITRRRTCEELQVGEGLRQHPSTLFLHRQGDHHEAIRQLGKVLNVVVVPEEGEKHREMTGMFSTEGSTSPPPFFLELERFRAALWRVVIHASKVCFK